MRVYWKFFIMELKSQMQYKVSFLLTTLGQFLTAFTMFFGINIDFVGKPLYYKIKFVIF